MKPSVIIPWFPGTNCHHETADAFERAGARAKIVLLKQLLDGRYRLSESDIIGLAGGFSWGDHLRGGWIAALDLVHRLRDQLEVVREKGIPIIGICNGFQILVAAGLLPGDKGLGQPTAVLDFNQSARFEHWYNTTVCLHEPAEVKCIWTEGLNGTAMQLPVAHGEGRLILTVEDAQCHVVATYGTPKGDASYHASPSGSPIAGICDASGRIMGLMPHPERRIYVRHGGDYGLRLFEAGVRAVR